MKMYIVCVCVAFSVHLFSIIISTFVSVCHRLFSIFYGLCLLLRSMELSLASNTHAHNLVHLVFGSHFSAGCLDVWLTILNFPFAAKCAKPKHWHFTNPIRKYFEKGKHTKKSTVLLSNHSQLTPPPPPPFKSKVIE